MLKALVKVKGEPTQHLKHDLYDKEFFMVKKIYFLVTSLVFSSWVFANDPKASSLKTSKLPLSLITYPLDLKKSEIVWTGYKGLGDYIRYSHDGIVAIKEGLVTYEKKHPKTIKITMDMTTISCRDIEKPSRRKRLEDHLKNDDFFAVQNFPMATFESTKIEETGPGLYKVFGSMMIRGIKNPISFDLQVTQKEEVYEAKADLTLNRTRWNVMYKSKQNISGFNEKIESTFETYKDRLIHDNFDLTIKIITKSQKKNIL